MSLTRNSHKQSLIIFKGSINIPFQVIFFDMNGVIVNDEDLHEKSFSLIAQKRGFVLSNHDYKKHFAGKTDLNGFDSFFRSQNINLSDQENKQMVSEKGAFYQQLATDSLSFYKNTKYFIDQLKNSSVTLGLVTSSAKKDVTTVLRVGGLTNVFSVTISSEDVTIGNPDPEPYLLAAKKIGVSPLDCLVIEDSPAGIRSAKDAGMRVVAVDFTHNKRDLQSADTILSNLSLDMISGL